MTDKTMEQIVASLAERTSHERVRFVPQAVNKEDKTALAVPYFDARFTMDRLDAVAGPFGWQTAVQEVKGALCVGIALYDRDKGEWVWKWDTGQSSDDDDDDDEGVGGAKALISGGLKRAGVQWGIGRDVYGLPKRRYAIKLNARGKFGGWETKPTVTGHSASPRIGISSPTLPLSAGAVTPHVDAFTPSAVPGLPGPADPVPNGRAIWMPAQWAARFTELVKEKALAQQDIIDTLAECKREDGGPDYQRAVELLEAKS